MVPASRRSIPTGHTIRAGQHRPHQAQCGTVTVYDLTCSRQCIGQVSLIEHQGKKGIFTAIGIRVARYIISAARHNISVILQKRYSPLRDCHQWSWLAD